MKIPNVDIAVLEAAMREFDASWRDTGEYAGWEQNRNYLHAVRYGGRLYPPKKIISIATGLPTGSFYGGRPSNSYLAERGLEVVRLRGAPDVTGEEPGPHGEQIREIDTAQKPFSPHDQEDARDRALRSVVERRGQAAFRRKLIEAFRGRCAISGCDVLAVLEAAHITPYLGPSTNDAGNGLLLRADLHTLWDLGLIAIEPDQMTVWISPTINDDMYRGYHGKEVIAPLPGYPQPSVGALRAQWELAVAGEPA